MRFDVVPLDLDVANAFVRQHHRHHPPVVGHKFALGAMERDQLVGVAIVGRPVTRALDNGWTLEVNRLATDGTKDACSFLYGAAWRATKSLGYRKLVTYTLASESGASLRGAGWRVVGTVTARPFSSPSRPRLEKHPAQARLRWEVA